MTKKCFKLKELPTDQTSQEYLDSTMSGNNADGKPEQEVFKKGVGSRSHQQGESGLATAAMSGKDDKGQGGRPQADGGPKQEGVVTRSQVMFNNQF